MWHLWYNDFSLHIIWCNLSFKKGIENLISRRFKMIKTAVPLVKKKKKQTDFVPRLWYAVEYNVGSETIFTYTDYNIILSWQIALMNEHLRLITGLLTLQCNVEGSFHEQCTIRCFDSYENDKVKANSTIRQSRMAFAPPGYHVHIL